MELETMPEPRVPASDWLQGVEAAVQTASLALFEPTLERLAICQADLESAVQRLKEFCGRPPVAVLPDLAPRLRQLQKQIAVVQAMSRQAAAFYQGIEQMDSHIVLGYAPRGLERAI